MHNPESRIEEGAEFPDVHLAPRDVLTRSRLHRIGLDGPGAAVAREIDRATDERATDTLTTEPGSGH